MAPLPFDSLERAVGTPVMRFARLFFYLPGRQPCVSVARRGVLRRLHPLHKPLCQTQTYRPKHSQRRYASVSGLTRSTHTAAPAAKRTLAQVCSSL